MYDDVNKDEMITRDYLALDRTELANSRTLLAYIRTAIAVFAAGKYRNGCPLRYIGNRCGIYGCITFCGSDRNCLLYQNEKKAGKVQIAGNAFYLI